MHLLMQDLLHALKQDFQGQVCAQLAAAVLRHAVYTARPSEAHAEGSL